MESGNAVRVLKARASALELCVTTLERSRELNQSVEVDERTEQDDLMLEALNWAIDRINNLVYAASDT